MNEFGFKYKNLFMKLKAIIITLIAINFLFFSCNKDGYGPSIKGKIVYRSCASTVIQVLDPAHYNLTQDTWQMSPSSPVYNKCI